MTGVVALAADLAADAAAAPTAAAAAAAFHAATARYGVTYLQARLYRRPAGVLTSAGHWAAGGVVARIAPAGWQDSAAFDYVCFTCNPLLEAIRGGQSLYRFSDFAPRSDPAYATYWDAMSEAAIGDAVCATAYGAGRSIATLHIGFADPAAAQEIGRVVQLAGLIAAQHLMTFAGPEEHVACPLTRRERDSLSLVAEGKSDWEIAVILGIAQPTARFHVDNARRKLQAVNRAHAVAKFVANGWM